MRKTPSTKSRFGDRSSRTNPSAPAVPRKLLSAGMPLDADVEIERQTRMEQLKAELVWMVAAGQGLGAIDRMMSVVVDLERENEQLAYRVMRANRFRFGRSTEKLSSEELQQILLAFGGDPVEAGVEPPVPVPPSPEQVANPDAVPDTGASPTPPEEKPAKKKRVRVRSMKVADSVERRITVVALSDEERSCTLCGREKKVFGHVEHECIRFIPARIVVDVERREKAGCVVCRQDVTVAPRPEEPSVVRKVDASLIAKLLSDKCTLALPVDRQRREFARLGLEIPDKTLQSYWSYGTDLLAPIAVATQSLVFGQNIVAADDSPLKTLNIGRPGVFRGHLWCFVGTTGIVSGPEMVAYGYTPTWEATEITDWFSAIDGMIQCDGYGGYGREVEDDEGRVSVAVPADRRLGCGMHIRSKFHAALLAKDRRAAVPMKYFADLYQIEEDCKRRGLDADARLEQRRLRSIPILDAFEAWTDVLHSKLLPKSPLRRATTYAINQRVFFRRCFTDGRFEIDNGRAERRIRLFAIARRNFLFTGSERGGERLAIIFTLVDNCLLLGIDPYHYLVDVIGKLEGGWPMRKLSELIPANWAAQKAAQDRPQ